MDDLSAERVDTPLPLIHDGKASPDDETTLEVRVEGEPGAIPANAFVDIVRLSLDLLDRVERAEHLGKPPHSGTWLIAQLRNSSAAVVLRHPDTPHAQTPLHVVTGVQRLAEVPELPPYFSPDAAKGLAQIGEKIRKHGLSGVTFTVVYGGQRLSGLLSESVVRNAESSIKETERSLGSVVGVLDVINLRHHNYISLYDDATRRAVRCRFRDEMLESVKEGLGKRVRVYGTLTRNRLGQVLNVDVERLEMLSDSPPVPSVDELAGIAPWYTGEQSTEDYLRSVRGA